MRCIFIVPYFGKLPQHFDLVLKSCEYNSDMFDWIFFTDDQSNYDYPNNVKVVNISFDDMKNIIQEKFDFDIILNKPYKLCDYKPAYGYIFENYISNYEYWGHCDIDLIFGKLSHFLTDDILKYDKILRAGHMTLYKNNFKNNRRFMKNIDGVERYKEVFTDETSCIFDEDNSSNDININTIWERYDYSKFNMDESIANIWYKGNVFKLIFVNEKYEFKIEKKYRSIFVWENGNLNRYFREENKLNKKEYMYIHFMARKIMMSEDVIGVNVYKIIPNRFEKLNTNLLNLEDFYSERWRYFNLQYFKVRSRNLKTKIIKYFDFKYNDR